MQDKGKVKMAPVVSGEYVRKLRISLGLTQLQFARLMEVGNITIANWEKNGLDGTRSSSFPNFKYLTTLLKNSMRHPEMLEAEKLIRYLRLASEHELMAYYIPYIDQMETDYLNVINSGSLTGVLFALLFDKELEKRGLPAPGDAGAGISGLKGFLQTEDEPLLEEISREAAKTKTPGKKQGKGA
jgi:DNA-binding transcriptional regulator YiaG